MTSKAEQKNLEAPDETRAFTCGALDLLQIGGAGLHVTARPAWERPKTIWRICGAASTPSAVCPTAASRVACRAWVR